MRKEGAENMSNVSVLAGIIRKQWVVAGGQ